MSSVESGLTIGHSCPRAGSKVEIEMSEGKRGGLRQIEFDKRMKERKEAGSTDVDAG